MRLRRSIVWIVSTIIGLAATYLTILAFDTTLERFTLAGAVLMALSVSSVVFIWLDLILRTNYLKT